MSMTENELRINGKSFSETITQIEEFMESDNVHGELFTALRSARDFMENLNEEIQQYRAIGTAEDIREIYSLCKILQNVVKDYSAIGTAEEFQALKEKSVPKKAIVLDRRVENGEAVEVEWKCPVCGLNVIEEPPCEEYCQKCGQKLDWQ